MSASTELTPATSSRRSPSRHPWRHLHALACACTLLCASSPALAQDVGFQLRRSSTWEDGGQATVRIELSQPAATPIDVSFTAGGSATALLDYTISTSPLQIPMGATSADIVIDPVADTDVEGSETIELLVTGLSAGSLDPTRRRHRLTVLDDDRPSWNPGTHALHPVPGSLQFPALRVGETSAEQSLQLRNRNDGPVRFDRARREGEAASELLLDYANSLPVLLNAGDTTSVGVRLQPTSPGPRTAALLICQFPAGFPATRIPIDAIAYGPRGAEIVVNAFLQPYTDTAGQVWIPDYELTGTSITMASLGPIANTTEDGLYRNARGGQIFGYSFELPNGTYDIRLHFAELVWNQAGMRRFDVRAEGQTIVDDLDLYATVGRMAAHQEVARIVLQDGRLDLELEASIGEALLSALEVRAIPIVDVDPPAIDFQVVEQGQFDTRPITLHNTGLADATVDSLTFDLTGSGSALDFALDIDGTLYWGGVSNVTHSISLVVPAGAEIALPLTFQPASHRDNQFTLRFEGDFDATELSVAGLGGAGGGWGYLHPLIDVDPDFLVDYDGSGTESVTLIGSSSHTHEPGHSIVAWEWYEEGLLAASVADTLLNVDTGDTLIELTIYDDNQPAISATDSRVVRVYAPDAVGGLLARFHDAGAGNPGALLDNVPAAADFATRVTALTMGNMGGKIGPSPFSTNTMVELTADFDVAALDDYVFAISGGDDSRLILDGQQRSGPGELALQLAPGSYQLQARFALLDVLDLPLDISVTIGGLAAPDFADRLTYDATTVLPVLHDMDASGSNLGGDLISLNGFGFHPEHAVTVEWGAVTFSAGHPSLGLQTWSDGLIQLVSPPGDVALGGGQSVGTIQVRVTTPAGSSASFGFEYIDSGPLPIQFDAQPGKAVPVHQATTAAWGPDGRLYVGGRDGEITAITYDEDYNDTNVTNYTGVSSLTNGEVLGITFSPFDPPSPVKIYVAHGLLYEFGGNPPSGPSEYTGQVSVLTGPAFDTPVPLITRLPVSNHDHAINGLEFDNNGDLLICVGGTTNAGVPHAQIGLTPESPLSGAILKARTSLPGFNGGLSYRNRSDDLENNDQNFGDQVYLAPGTHVSVHAAGFRNSYDLALATSGLLYATDNGPNSGYGFASTGPNSDSGSHPDTDNDELNLIERGNYYGHPNRNRGIDDPRQNIYHGESGTSIPETFTQWIGLHSSSSNGIVEYRANTFGGAMRAELLTQRFSGRVKRHVLSDDGRSIISGATNLPQMIALDIVTGPGGVILPVSYLSNAVKLMTPDDQGVVGATAYDITPWRGPITGGTPFVIGGENFGTLLDTTVTIDGQPATLSSVSARRIIGTTPAGTSVTQELVDVVVTVDGWPRTLADAFLYLPATPGAWLGGWRADDSLPTAIEEVSAAAIDGQLYVVGAGSAQTLAYDLLAGGWTSGLATRALAGGHGSCEVVDGKLYLFGGLGGAAGKVQIYDPVLDQWSPGADMPWAGWGVATCVIDGAVFAAGGLAGGQTVAYAARYDPGLDLWTAIASMPNATKVNHAAAGSDGASFFVFGGRAGDGSPTPGETFLQIYDPLFDSWETSEDLGSSLSPMPAPRGGTGRAVFDGGEFYVFGGETSDADSDGDATPDKVFPQVQVYDPLANSWRSEASMSTPRHGLSPVLFQGRIFLAGGATENGSAPSPVMDVFSRQ